MSRTTRNQGPRRLGARSEVEHINRCLNFGYRNWMYGVHGGWWYCYGVRWVESEEELVAEAKREWAKLKRDGVYSDTGACSGFKRAAADKCRLGNKRLCRKILRGEARDDEPYPIRREGSGLAWNFW